MTCLRSSLDEAIFAITYGSHWANAEKIKDTLPATATTGVIYRQKKLQFTSSKGPMYANTDSSNIFINNINKVGRSVKECDERNS